MSNKILYDFAEELTEMDNERERLSAVIERGQELHKPKNIETYTSVPGCVSKVWLKIKEDEKGIILIEGWAQALIVRGYLALLCEAFTGKTISEILGSDQDIEQFVKNSKLPISTIPSRNNAFANLHLFLKKQANHL